MIRDRDQVRDSNHWRDHDQMRDGDQNSVQECGSSPPPFLHSDERDGDRDREQYDRDRNQRYHPQSMHSQHDWRDRDYEGICESDKSHDRSPVRGRSRFRDRDDRGRRRDYSRSPESCSARRSWLASADLSSAIRPLPLTVPRSRDSGYYYQQQCLDLRRRELDIERDRLALEAEKQRLSSTRSSIVTSPQGRSSHSCVTPNRSLDWKGVLSPVRSPYTRLLASDSSHRRVRRSRSFSPSRVGEEKKDYKDNEFRSAIKVLLDLKQDLAVADGHKKLSEPPHFSSYHAKSGKDRVLLPPHPHVTSTYSFVHRTMEEEAEQRKKTPSASSSSKARRGEPFRPESCWRKASNMYDGGVQGDFLYPNRSVDESTFRMFDFPSLAAFHKVREQPLSFNKKQAETLEKNTLHGVAASSYQFHFLDGAREASADLRSQLDTSSLIPTVGCSDDARKHLEEAAARMTIGLDRLDLFVRHASHAACYSSAFHVFSDVLYTLVRRDPYINKLKHYHQSHANQLRGANFASPDLFPKELLQDLLPQISQEAQQQSVSALADHLVPNRQNQKHYKQSGQQQQSNSNRYDRGTGRGARNRRRSRSRSRSRSCTRGRDDSPRGHNQARGPFQGSSRGRGRGGVRGRGGHASASQSKEDSGKSK